MASTCSAHRVADRQAQGLAPLPELRLLLLGNPEEFGHHLRGIAIGEGAHELAGAGRCEGVDEVVHDRPHPGTELVDGVGCEGPADEAAEAVVPVAFDVEDDVPPHLGQWPVGDALVGEVVDAGLAEPLVVEDGGALLIAEDGRSQRGLRVPVALRRLSDRLGVDPEVGGQEVQRGRNSIGHARCGGHGIGGHGSSSSWSGPQCVPAGCRPSARGRRKTGRGS